MPNWCENKLIISSGANEFIESFTSHDENGRRFFDFEKTLPIPEGFISDGRWFHWCVSNWGTKWNCSASTTSANEEWTEIYFDTAWSPPIELLRTLSKKCPSIHFDLYYCELGGYFAGIAQFDGMQFSEIVDCDPIAMAIEQFGWDPALFEEEAEVQI